MRHFGAEVGFRRLNQIQKPALWCLWKHFALARLHGNSELSLAVLEVVSFLDADGAPHFKEPLLGLVPSPPARSGFALVEVELGALMIVVSSGIIPSIVSIPAKRRKQGVSISITSQGTVFSISSKGTSKNRKTA